MKNLPKSLHTVTVLVNVARYIQNLEPAGMRPNAETAIDEALDLLGYRSAADAYGLGAAAVKQLESGK